MSYVVSGTLKVPPTIPKIFCYTLDESIGDERAKKATKLLASPNSHWPVVSYEVVHNGKIVDKFPPDSAEEEKK